MEGVASAENEAKSTCDMCIVKGCYLVVKGEGMITGR